MSEIERHEAAQRFDESMKRAVSRAKELAILLNQPMYNKWATGLDRMRVQGIHLAGAKSRTKGQVTSDLDIFQKNMNAKEQLNG